MLGVNVEDLTKVLDVGRASLFGYRTGKRNITNKAWRKLEEAEQAAGVASQNNTNPPPSIGIDLSGFTDEELLTELERRGEDVGSLRAELAALRAMLERLDKKI